MPRAGATVVSPKLYQELFASGHFPQIGTITRPSQTRAPSGATVSGAGDLIYANVPLRLASAGGGEVRRKDDTIVRQAFRAILAAGYPDIRESDTLTVAGADYDILSVDTASSDGRALLTLEQVR